jgi:hypothetical protein
MGSHNALPNIMARSLTIPSFLHKLCNTISSIQYIFEIAEKWSKGKVILVDSLP